MVDFGRVGLDQPREFAKTHREDLRGRRQSTLASEHFPTPPNRAMKPESVRLGKPGQPLLLYRMEAIHVETVVAEPGPSSELQAFEVNLI